MSADAAARHFSLDGRAEGRDPGADGDVCARQFVAADFAQGRDPLRFSPQAYAAL